jgi:hypothetical protein
MTKISGPVVRGIVIPAKAGIPWTPASAGVTKRRARKSRCIPTVDRGAGMFYRGSPADCSTATSATNFWS